MVVGDRGARLVVATYNVRRCIGTDGRQEPERTALVIRELAADIVGLQEVDSHPTREGFADQLELLAAKTGMKAIAGPTLWRHDGGYGNGLLTRLPIERIQRHNLSFKARESRGAIEADLLAGNARVKVITTHLGLGIGERRFQTLKLLSLVEQPCAEVLILMGDFNDWHRLSALPRTVDGVLGKAPSCRSFPSRCPVLALDRIWVRPSTCLQTLEAIQGKLVRVSSDHLPVRATVELPAAGLL